MHREEVNALRRKAAEFLEGSRRALEERQHDLACFLSDRAVQLYLKSILLQLVGDYTRMHSVRALLGEVVKLKPSRVLDGFTRENRARISSLEDAHIIARYSAKEYDEADAEDSVRLAEQIMKLAGEAVTY